MKAAVWGAISCSHNCTDVSDEPTPESSHTSLAMEEPRSSETWLHFYQTLRCHIPQATFKVHIYICILISTRNYNKLTVSLTETRFNESNQDKLQTTHLGYLLFCQARFQICEKRLLASSCLSVRVTASNNSAPAGRNLINPLTAELNPICHLLALLRAHHILRVSRVRVKFDV